MGWKAAEKLIRHLKILRGDNHHFHSSTDQISISNEVLAIIERVTPMEDSLELIVDHLFPNIVTSVIQEQPNPKVGFRFFIWAVKRKSLLCSASRNLIVDMLVRDDKFELYWKTLHELKDSSIPIASDAFQVLIAAYVKKGKAEKAVESFGMMRDFDCEPDIFVYNMVLHVMVQKKVFLLALAVYNQMLKSNCSPNIVTYSILIDGFCKTSSTQDALKLFDEMTIRGISPNKITYSIILSGLCQNKRTDHALILFNNMKGSGCCPDEATYNVLLNGFCKVGRLDEAFALLRSFEKDGYVAGVNGYGCLIRGLFKARRYDEAHSLYWEMLNLKYIKPDVVLYTIMLQGLLQEGKVMDAMKLLNEMTDRGLKPDTQCYNAVIKRFCDMGVLDEARSLLLEISKNDSVPNTFTYTILISGLCKNGLVGEAQNIFNEMEKLGCFPSVVTFNCLIDGLCKAQKIDEGHLLFCKMEIGRKPSVLLRLSQGSNRALGQAGLQTMVEKLCESGLVLKAYKLLTQLAHNSEAVPDIKTYNILINGFCKARNINGAFKLFKDMQLKGLIPDSVTYGTLINGLQRAKREEDAFAVFDQMVKNGCTPTSIVYKTLMTWACRQKNVKLAFSLWLKYLRSVPTKREDDEQNLKAVERYIEKGEIEMAIRGFIQMDSKLKKEFDLAPYTILLIGMCQSQKVDKAFLIFSILEEFKVNVTPPSCVMLIKGLCCEGEEKLDLAKKVFLYTLEKGFMLGPDICNQLLRRCIVSKDKRGLALDLLNRMKSFGYDLNSYIYASNKLLLNNL